MAKRAPRSNRRFPRGESRSSIAEEVPSERVGSASSLRAEPLRSRWPDHILEEIRSFEAQSLRRALLGARQKYERERRSRLPWGLRWCGGFLRAFRPPQS